MCAVAAPLTPSLPGSSDVFHPELRQDFNRISTCSTLPRTSPAKSYDYLLKFLLVGDSDVGKHEILQNLENGASESPFCSITGIGYKTTTILLDGKRVKLELWDTSGQGRFCTIIRSYSRGAQGILLVYDITNKWSFDNIDRWLKEVDQHAPGVPKVLIGNRLHLEFKRQVSEATAQMYATRHGMTFFEASPLCDFNIVESFTELSRLALQRNGMERLWKSNKVLSLQELCCRTIVTRTNVYGVEQLPLPTSLKSYLKSYSMSVHKPRLTNGANRLYHSHTLDGKNSGTKVKHNKDGHSTKRPSLTCYSSQPNPDSPNSSPPCSRKSCVIS